MTHQRKTTAILVAVVFLLALDRFLKALALAGVTAPLVEPHLAFGLSRNYGIAFSLPLSGWPVWLLTGTVILALIFLAVGAHEKGKTANVAALAPIVAGAASNLFDRLHYGYVIDYWEVAYFSILNLADAMIFMGVVGLIFYKK